MSPRIFRPVQKLDYPRFAVLGAGHGGQAMAGHLALKGFTVNLYNKTPERIAPIQARGGIELDGEIKGFGKLHIVTSDIEEAVRDADIIMVVIPACGHRSMAERLAPYVEDGQIIVLHPGRTGGALEFRSTMLQNGAKADFTVAEAQTFIYASRSVNPAQSRIFRIKNVVPLAALPAIRTEEVLQAVNIAYPQFVAAPNVLKTSLDNMGAIFHPALTIMNGGRIESTQGDFEYYCEGITPSVAKILEAMDRERVAVAEALEVKALSAREWLEVAYSATGNTLYEAMLNNEGYKGIKAPPNLNTRYIFEDVPTSLVPIASLGRQIGVSTPTIDFIIHMANLIHETDYWQTGRTTEKLGLAGLTVKEIQSLVNEGVI